MSPKLFKFSSIAATLLSLLTFAPNAAAKFCGVAGGEGQKGFSFAVPCFEGTFPGPAGKGKFGELVSVVIDIALLVAGSVAVVFLIVGAYRYITASGNEEQMEAAKKTMTGAIIGLVVVILAFAIIGIITNVLISGSTGLGF